MFRLALRQTEGLVASVIALLGLDLAVPDHTTLSRRAETLEVPRPRCGREPVHLLVDSTGLRLCGPGEWRGEGDRPPQGPGAGEVHLAAAADTRPHPPAVLAPQGNPAGFPGGGLLDREGR